MSLEERAKATFAENFIFANSKVAVNVQEDTYTDFHNNRVYSHSSEPPIFNPSRAGKFSHNDTRTGFNGTSRLPTARGPASHEGSPNAEVTSKQDDKSRSVAALPHSALKTGPP